ncbi:MAG: NYN domain-containing protein [Rhodothermales bacterium]
MRYTKREKDFDRPQHRRAAVFVDYENLHHLLNERLESRDHPDEVIMELLGELRAYLQDENQTQTSLTLAYADFSELGGSGPFVQRSLCLQKAEPRFVSKALQANASEIQLCVDAVDLLHSRPDIDTFVLVTGDRGYLPLVQQFQRYGCQAFVVALDPPPSLRDAQTEDPFLLDAAGLLGETSRQKLAVDAADGSHRNGSGTAAGSNGTTRTHRAIADEASLRALEIIDEHFGQYDEVYLTPLLRKLSEMLDDSRYDPKSLISDLEVCGAVMLEKRRGFPYDYTVLIVNGDHPDVSSLDRSFYRDEDAFGSDYEEEHPENQNDYGHDEHHNGAAPEEENEIYAEHDDEDDWDEPA